MNFNDFNTRHKKIEAVLAPVDKEVFVDMLESKNWLLFEVKLVHSTTVKLRTGLNNDAYYGYSSDPYNKYKTEALRMRDKCNVIVDWGVSSLDDESITLVHDEYVRLFDDDSYAEKLLVDSGESKTFIDLTYTYPEEALGTTVFIMVRSSNYLLVPTNVVVDDKYSTYLNKFNIEVVAMDGCLPPIKMPTIAYGLDHYQVGSAWFKYMGLLNMRLMYFLERINCGVGNIHFKETVNRYGEVEDVLDDSKNTIKSLSFFHNIFNNKEFLLNYTTKKELLGTTSTGLVGTSGFAGVADLCKSMTSATLRPVDIGNGERSSQTYLPKECHDYNNFMRKEIIGKLGTTSIDFGSYDSMYPTTTEIKASPDTAYTESSGLNIPWGIRGEIFPKGLRKMFIPRRSKVFPSGKRLYGRLIFSSFNLEAIINGAVAPLFSYSYISTNSSQCNGTEEDRYNIAYGGSSLRILHTPFNIIHSIPSGSLTTYQFNEDSLMEIDRWDLLRFKHFMSTLSNVEYMENIFVHIRKRRSKDMVPIKDGVFKDVLQPDGSYIHECVDYTDIHGVEHGANGYNIINVFKYNMFNRHTWNSSPHTKRVLIGHMIRGYYLSNYDIDDDKFYNSYTFMHNLGDFILSEKYKNGDMSCLTGISVDFGLCDMYTLLTKNPFSGGVISQKSYEPYKGSDGSYYYGGLGIISPMQNTRVDSKFSVIGHNYYKNNSTPEDCILLERHPNDLFKDGVEYGNEPHQRYYKNYIPQHSIDIRIADDGKEPGVLKLPYLGTVLGPGGGVGNVSIGQPPLIDHSVFLSDRSILIRKGDVGNEKWTSAKYSNAESIMSSGGIVSGWWKNIDGCRTIVSNGDNLGILVEGGTDVGESGLSNTGMNINAPDRVPVSDGLAGGQHYPLPVNMTSSPGIVIYKIDAKKLQPMRNGILKDFAAIHESVYNFVNDMTNSNTSIVFKMHIEKVDDDGGCYTTKTKKSFSDEYCKVLERGSKHIVASTLKGSKFSLLRGAAKFIFQSDTRVKGYYNGIHRDPISISPTAGDIALMKNVVIELRTYGTSNLFLDIGNINRESTNLGLAEWHPHEMLVRFNKIDTDRPSNWFERALVVPDSLSPEDKVKADNNQYVSYTVDGVVRRKANFTHYYFNHPSYRIIDAMPITCKIGGDFFYNFRVHRSGDIPTDTWSETKPLMDRQNRRSASALVGTMHGLVYSYFDAPASGNNLGTDGSKIKSTNTSLLGADSVGFYPTSHPSLSVKPTMGGLLFKLAKRESISESLLQRYDKSKLYSGDIVNRSGVIPYTADILPNNENLVPFLSLTQDMNDYYNEMTENEWSSIPPEIVEEDFISTPLPLQPGEKLKLNGMPSAANTFLDGKYFSYLVRKNSAGVPYTNYTPKILSELMSMMFYMFNGVTGGPIVQLTSPFGFNPLRLNYKDNGVLPIDAIDVNMKSYGELIDTTATEGIDHVAKPGFVFYKDIEELRGMVYRFDDPAFVTGVRTLVKSIWYDLGIKSDCKLLHKSLMDINDVFSMLDFRLSGTFTLDRTADIVVTTPDGVVITDSKDVSKYELTGKGEFDLTNRIGRPKLRTLVKPYGNIGFIDNDMLIFNTPNTLSFYCAITDLAINSVDILQAVDVDVDFIESKSIVNSYGVTDYSNAFYGMRLNTMDGKQIPIEPLDLLGDGSATDYLQRAEIRKMFSHSVSSRMIDIDGVMTPSDDAGYFANGRSEVYALPDGTTRYSGDSKLGFEKNAPIDLTLADELVINGFIKVPMDTNKNEVQMASIRGKLRLYPLINRAFNDRTNMLSRTIVPFPVPNIEAYREQSAYGYRVWRGNSSIYGESIDGAAPVLEPEFKQLFNKIELTLRFKTHDGLRTSDTLTNVVDLTYTLDNYTKPSSFNEDGTSADANNCGDPTITGNGIPYIEFDLIPLLRSAGYEEAYEQWKGIYGGAGSSTPFVVEVMIKQTTNILHFGLQPCVTDNDLGYRMINQEEYALDAENIELNGKNFKSMKGITGHNKWGGDIVPLEDVVEDVYSSVGMYECVPNKYPSLVEGEFDFGFNGHSGANPYTLGEALWYPLGDLPAVLSEVSLRGNIYPTMMYRDSSVDVLHGEEINMFNPALPDGHKLELAIGGSTTYFPASFATSYDKTDVAWLSTTDFGAGYTLALVFLDWKPFYMESASGLLEKNIPLAKKFFYGKPDTIGEATVLHKLVSHDIALTQVYNDDLEKRKINADPRFVYFRKRTSSILNKILYTFEHHPLCIANRITKRDGAAFDPTVEGSVDWNVHGHRMIVKLIHPLECNGYDEKLFRIIMHDKFIQMDMPTIGNSIYTTNLSEAAFRLTIPRNNFVRIATHLEIGHFFNPSIHDKPTVYKENLFNDSKLIRSYNTGTFMALNGDSIRIFKDGDSPIDGLSLNDNVNAYLSASTSEYIVEWRDKSQVFANSYQYGLEVKCDSSQIRYTNETDFTPSEYDNYNISLEEITYSYLSNCENMFSSSRGRIYVYTGEYDFTHLFGIYMTNHKKYSKLRLTNNSRHSRVDMWTRQDVMRTSNLKPVNGIHDITKFGDGTVNKLRQPSAAIPYMNKHFVRAVDIDSPLYEFEMNLPTSGSGIPQITILRDHNFFPLREGLFYRLRKHLHELCPIYNLELIRDFWHFNNHSADSRFDLYDELYMDYNFNMGRVVYDEINQTNTRADPEWYEDRLSVYGKYIICKTQLQLSNSIYENYIANNKKHYNSGDAKWSYHRPQIADEWQDGIEPSYLGITDISNLAELDTSVVPLDMVDTLLNEDVLEMYSYFMSNSKKLVVGRHMTAGDNDIYPIDIGPVVYDVIVLTGIGYNASTRLGNSKVTLEVPLMSQPQRYVTRLNATTYNQYTNPIPMDIILFEHRHSELFYGVTLNFANTVPSVYGNALNLENMFRCIMNSTTDRFFTDEIVEPAFVLDGQPEVAVIDYYDSSEELASAGLTQTPAMLSKMKTFSDKDAVLSYQQREFKPYNKEINFMLTVNNVAWRPLPTPVGKIIGSLIMTSNRYKENILHSTTTGEHTQHALRVNIPGNKHIEVKNGSSAMNSSKSPFIASRMTRRYKDKVYSIDASGDSKTTVGDNSLFAIGKFNYIPIPSLEDLSSTEVIDNVHNKYYSDLYGTSYVDDAAISVGNYKSIHNPVLPVDKKLLGLQDIVIAYPAWSQTLSTNIVLDYRDTRCGTIDSTGVQVYLHILTDGTGYICYPESSTSTKLVRGFINTEVVRNMIDARSSETESNVLMSEIGVIPPVYDYNLYSDDSGNYGYIADWTKCDICTVIRIKFFADLDDSMPDYFWSHTMTKVDIVDVDNCGAFLVKEPASRLYKYGERYTNTLTSEFIPVYNEVSRTEVITAVLPEVDKLSDKVINKLEVNRTLNRRARQYGVSGSEYNPFSTLYAPATANIGGVVDIEDHYGLHGYVEENTTPTLTIDELNYIGGILPNAYRYALQPTSDIKLNTASYRFGVYYPRHSVPKTYNVGVGKAGIAVSGVREDDHIIGADDSMAMILMNLHSVMSRVDITVHDGQSNPGYGGTYLSGYFNPSGHQLNPISYTCDDPIRRYLGNSLNRSIGDVLHRPASIINSGASTEAISIINKIDRYSNGNRFYSGNRFNILNKTIDTSVFNLTGITTDNMLGPTNDLPIWMVSEKELKSNAVTRFSGEGFRYSYDDRNLVNPMLKNFLLENIPQIPFTDLADITLIPSSNAVVNKYSNRSIRLSADNLSYVYESVEGNVYDSSVISSVKHSALDTIVESGTYYGSSGSNTNPDKFKDCGVLLVDIGLALSIGGHNKGEDSLTDIYMTGDEIGNVVSTALGETSKVMSNGVKLNSVYAESQKVESRSSLLNPLFMINYDGNPFDNYLGVEEGDAVFKSAYYPQETYLYQSALNAPGQVMMAGMMVNRIAEVTLASLGFTPICSVEGRDPNDYATNVRYGFHEGEARYYNFNTIIRHSCKSKVLFSIYKHSRDDKSKIYLNLGLRQTNLNLRNSVDDLSVALLMGMEIRDRDKDMENAGLTFFSGVDELSPDRGELHIKTVNKVKTSINGVDTWQLVHSPLFGFSSLHRTLAPATVAEQVGAIRPIKDKWGPLTVIKNRFVKGKGSGEYTYRTPQLIYNPSSWNDTQDFTIKDLFGTVEDNMCDVYPYLSGIVIELMYDSRSSSTIQPTELQPIITFKDFTPTIAYSEFITHGVFSEDRNDPLNTDPFSTKYGTGHNNRLIWIYKDYRYSGYVTHPLERKLAYNELKAIHTSSDYEIRPATIEEIRMLFPGMIVT